MTEKRFFAAREIDALIPQLEHIFDHIQICKNRIEALVAQGLSVPSSPAAADLAQQQMTRSQVEFLMQAVEEDVHHIHSLGGVAKDLDAGLVDFLGDLEGREVWLCWKKGEPRVRFWHPLDGGFAHRKAIPYPETNPLIH